MNGTLTAIYRRGIDTLDQFGQAKGVPYPSSLKEYDRRKALDMDIPRELQNTVDRDRVVYQRQMEEIGEQFDKIRKTVWNGIEVQCRALRK